MRDFFAHLSDTINRHYSGVAFSTLRLEFLLAVLTGMVVTMTLGRAFGAEPGTLWAMLVFLAGVAATAMGMRQSYLHDALGLCNFITILRLALTASLAALLWDPAPLSADLWLAFGIATAALVLDGVDGWAARRAGLQSVFGARFDMEVDALLALVLALVAFRTGQAGTWIVLLGLPRYIFVLAGYIWPMLTRPVPETLSRKAVCVLQIGTLVAFLVPVLPASLPTLAAFGAAAALAWSFAGDIRVLLASDR